MIDYKYPCNCCGGSNYSGAYKNPFSKDSPVCGACLKNVDCPNCGKRMTFEKTDIPGLCDMLVCDMDKTTIQVLPWQ